MGKVTYNLFYEATYGKETNARGKFLPHIPLLICFDGYAYISGGRLHAIEYG